RGLETTVNLDLTGAGASQWHVRFSEGRIRFARGLAADARSTARIATPAFVRLLAGDLSLSTALFTGQLRIAGEGHAQFMVGAIVGLFRQLGRAPGLAGLAGKAYSRLILRLARHAPAAKKEAATA
ncbi:MAG TPA: SCP2 sterol-binding domain-containing protein, partial [Planctomycetota bacterium]|nr:SCP2 sterol-binding domain-containing protein [Planctomycetota bacterium]